MLKLVPYFLIAAGVAIIAIVMAFLTPTAEAVHPKITVASVVTPVASALQPTQGGLTGGEQITISGTDLTGVAGVEFNGMSATIVTQTDASITVTAPHSIDYTAGDVPVELYTASGPLSAELTYTYATLSNVDRQMEYAFAHWNNYNTAQYGNFNDWGGDCINFVSQTLVARGWAPTDEWFNDAQEEWGTAFIYVPGFDEWLSAHPEYGAVRSELGDGTQAKIGDVVLFDWDGDGSLDHAQVVSDVSVVNGETTISMVGHNLDSRYRTIPEALKSQGTPNAQVFIWSIPALEL